MATTAVSISGSSTAPFEGEYARIRSNVVVRYQGSIHGLIRTPKNGPISVAASKPSMCPATDSPCLSNLGMGDVHMCIRPCRRQGQESNLSSAGPGRGPGERVARMRRALCAVSENFKSSGRPSFSKELDSGLAKHGQWTIHLRQGERSGECHLRLAAARRHRSASLPLRRGRRSRLSLLGERRDRRGGRRFHCLRFPYFPVPAPFLLAHSLLLPAEVCRNWDWAIVVARNSVDILRIHRRNYAADKGGTRPNSLF